MIIQKTKKYYVEFSIIVFLVGLSVFLASQVRDTTVDFIWTYDDTGDLSVANSLKEGKGFVTTFAPWKHKTTVDELIRQYPDLIRQTPTPPFYHILLAGFFKITSPEPPHLFLFGSIFNTIIISALATLLFFFSYKYFGRDIAFFSTLIIIMSFWIIFSSVHVTDRPLAYLFMLSAFFFLKKNNLNYFLFGVCTSLGILSNPLATVLLPSYVVFLLVTKRFKGILIFIGTYIVLMTPWFIQNLKSYGDFGVGMGIPFTNKISELFGFTDSYERYRDVPLGGHSDFFEIFSNYINELAHNSMELITFLATIGITFLIFYFVQDKLLQRTNKKLVNNIDLEKSNLFLFTIIFFVISVIAFFYFSNIAEDVASIRYFIPLFFLLAPLGILVLKKLLSKAFHSYSKNNLITFIIIAIILVPLGLESSFASVDTINSQNIASAQNNIPGLDELHSWILENLPLDSIVATNYPIILFEETSLTSIGTPHKIFISNRKEAEKYLNHYNPDYLVLYSKDSNTYSALHSPATIPNPDLNSLGTFSFTKIYEETHFDDKYKHRIFVITKPGG